MNYTYKTISNSLEFEAMLSSPDLVPPPNVAFKFYTPTYQQSRRYIWKAHTWYATGPTTKYNSNPQSWYHQKNQPIFNRVLTKYRRWLGLSDSKNGE